MLNLLKRKKLSPDVILMGQGRSVNYVLNRKWIDCIFNKTVQKTRYNLTGGLPNTRILDFSEKKSTAFFSVGTSSLFFFLAIDTAGIQRQRSPYAG